MPSPSSLSLPPHFERRRQTRDFLVFSLISSLPPFFVSPPSTMVAACISRGVSTAGRVVSAQQPRASAAAAGASAPLAPAAMLRSAAAASTSAAAGSASQLRRLSARRGVSSRVRIGFLSVSLHSLSISLSSLPSLRKEGRRERQRRDSEIEKTPKSSQRGKKPLPLPLFSFDVAPCSRIASLQPPKHTPGCLPRRRCRAVVAAGGIRKVRGDKKKRK